MYTLITLMIFAEVILTAFIAWGFMHEEKFISFEDKVIAAAKQKLCMSAKKRAALKRRKLNDKMSYSPEAPSKSKSSSSRAA